MPMVTVELDERENKIVEIYKIKNGCYDKRQAIRDLIREYDRIKKGGLKNVGVRRN